MDSTFDLVTVGNARIDLFISIYDANKHFRLNEQTKELCVRYADKATIDKLEDLPGGNAANVAVGLSRLGFKSAIVAEIGTDEFSQKIINNLKNEKVSNDFLKISAQSSSLISVIINFKSDRTIFAEDFEMEHDFNFNNINTKWVYLTSLGRKWEDAYQKTIDLCKKTGSKLVFNPGTLQLDDNFEKIRGAFAITEILFVNKEEAKSILASSGETITTEEIKDLLLPLKKLGPKSVVITDGKNGSCSINETDEVFAYGIIECETVEKTGAGDAYASGFLSAILAGQNYNTAMLWGAKNSSSVVTKVGAQTGLLTKEKIENE